MHNQLVCPQCLGEIRSIDQNQGIKCQVCELIYPINQGIPIFLIDQASKEDS